VTQETARETTPGSAPIPHWPGRMVSVGDHEVFVRSAPDPKTPDHAEPALCVHGLEGSSRNWTDLMDLLRTQLACDALARTVATRSPRWPRRSSRSSRSGKTRCT